MYQPIKELQEGSSFRFAHTNKYRNLKIGRSSSGSITITGEHLDGGSWKPLGSSYTICTTVLVEKLIESYADREQTVKRRGRRPSNFVMTFPTDKEFSIREVAEANNVSPSDVFIYMKKHNINLTLIREERRASRGKATRIFKLA